MVELSAQSTPQHTRNFLTESEREVNELNERMQSEKQVRSQETEALKLQQTWQRKELQDQVDELEAECRMKGEGTRTVNRITTQVCSFLQNVVGSNLWTKLRHRQCKALLACCQPCVSCMKSRGALRVHNHANYTQRDSNWSWGERAVHKLTVSLFSFSKQKCNIAKKPTDREVRGQLLRSDIIMVSINHPKIKITIIPKVSNSHAHSQHWRENISAPLLCHIHYKPAWRLWRHCPSLQTEAGRCVGG